jgi:glycosyltransferase involved in cell wall biosynthesis
LARKEKELDGGGAMKKSVVLRAPLLSNSGYGTHARQIFRWLETKDVEIAADILNWGATSWFLNHQAENGLVGRVIAAAKQPTRTPDLMISLQLPNEWQRLPGVKCVGMSAVVETDRCNPEWVKACSQMDRVIVPSNFCRGLVSSSTTDVRVVPEAFHEDIATAAPLDLPQVKTKKNFLLVGQLSGMKPDLDRKNIFYTVKWFCEEFKDTPDVGLIIKTNLGTNSTFNKNSLRNIFTNLVNEVRRGGKSPPIYLINGEMTTAEIASLYRSPKVTALLSLTRGEGYGLPILEAAASDLPVICTGWSGHLDFMSRGKFISVDYDLAPVPAEKVDDQIFVSGARWAIPREADAKKKMRKFISLPDAPKKWAVELGGKLREEYSLDAVFKCYDRELGDLL